MSIDVETVKKIFEEEIKKCSDNIIDRINKIEGYVKFSEVLTVSEAAELYNVSNGTLRDLARKDIIKSRKSGATWLFKKRDLDNYFKRT